MRAPGLDSSRLRRKALTAAALLGFFATAVQVLFTRELLVVASGNELSMAVILGGWLLGIGAGGLAARLAVPVLTRRTGATAFAATAALAVMVASAPAALAGFRGFRRVFTVQPGEYVDLERIALGSFLLCLPVTLGIGFVFPALCRLASAGDTEEEGRDAGLARAVAQPYALEALGSAGAGLLLSFVLLPAWSPVRIVLAAMAVGCACAALLAREATPGRRVAPAIASGGLGALALLAVAAATVDPRWLRAVDARLCEARWRAAGVVGGEGDARLAANLDTRYQNLAIVEAGGQSVLYANGEVAFVFPDPMASERAVHVAMAQNPRARRVLCLGGNPLGEIPELLRYPVERIVMVDLDPGVLTLLRSVADDAVERVMGDSRVTYVAADGPRFVRTCRDRFDAILVSAPAPMTLAGNRYHTVEFLQGLAALLEPGGFVSTELAASERLEGRAAALAASVYHSLRAVFPVVLATAESRMRFFAGYRAAEGEGSTGLTLDRRTLFERSRAAALETAWFRPEYFLGADEMDPVKVRAVEARLMSLPVQLNTIRRPVACFLGLRLWGVFSGSSSRWLDAAARLALPGVLAGFAAAGLVTLGLGLALRGAGAPRRRAGARLLVGLLLLSTGAFAMAAEVACLAIFQSVLGYVYARIGVIVATFMAGLVGGAVMAEGWLRRRGSAVVALTLVEGLLIAVGAMLAASLRPHGSPSPVAVEAMGIIGAGVGAEFPLGVALLERWGAPRAASTALAWASDHVGAAAGALVAGAVLIPVLGLGGTCAVLVSLKGLALVWLAVAKAAGGA